MGALEVGTKANKREKGAQVGARGERQRGGERMVATQQNTAQYGTDSANMYMQHQKSNRRNKGETSL